MQVIYFTATWSS